MASKRKAEDTPKDEEASSKRQKKQVRIWTDGCFDMMHYGHANALRQAKALGDYLIVGVHSDADIIKNKGPPVMSEDERYLAVESCKWVDEVVRGAPFQTQLEVLEEHNVDWCVHGDDAVATSSGEDCYAKVKAAGKFKTIPRTRGVSTTDLVGRMLLVTRSHFIEDRNVPENIRIARSHFSEDSRAKSPYTRLSEFVPSTRQILLFSEGKAPKATDKRIYIDGTFDLFHTGHIQILKKAKELGDYLIVGVHDDKTINQIKGSNHPIMNVHERTLSVLACKYANEVIIGAPYSPTKEMLEAANIALVVHGSDSVVPAIDGSDPYKVPKEMGIFKQIESPSALNTSDIIDRIIANRMQYEKRNRQKEQREVDAINSSKAKDDK